MKYKGDNYKKYYRSKVPGGSGRELAVQIETAKAELAEFLVEYRERRAMTQKQLAHELSVKQQVISRIESGTNNITLETLLKILHVLHISLKVHIAKSQRHSKILQFV